VIPVLVPKAIPGASELMTSKTESYTQFLVRELMGDAVCLSELYLDLARETKQHLEGVNEVLECSLCLLFI